MGLFEQAGRQFERLKQNVTSAAEQSAGYECATCGTRFFTEQEQCPDCGAEDIVATSAEGPSSATDGSTTPSEDSSSTQTDDSSAAPADADGS